MGMGLKCNPILSYIVRTLYFLIKKNEMKYSEPNFTNYVKRGTIMSKYSNKAMYRNRRKQQNEEEKFYVSG